MNALFSLKTNGRLVIVFLMLILPFETYSQSNTDPSKDKKQSEKKETSYLDVVGPQPITSMPENPKAAPLPKEEPKKAAPLQTSQDSRLNKLRQLEEAHGPYDKSLLEELIPLGVEYAEQGENERARDAFLRSLEIHRVNYGLHSPGKFAIVERLILVNRDLQEWTEVNRYYEYLYWLYRRTYGEYSTELLPMLNALIAWKTEAINEQLFGDGKILFNEAQKASRRAREIVKRNSQSQPTQLKETQATLAQ